MQRKNSILKKSFKSGIAMIMAIFIIVLITTIMALALSLTSKTTKQTTDLYIYEQAVLLSKSAAEYALLKISQNLPCSDLDEHISNQDGYYNIDIKLRYIYTTNAPCLVNGGTLYTIVNTPEQNGSVLMDITVDVNDTSVTTEPIRYFKRTIQKL
ncbi:hypothetical protein [Sulfurimonas sp.]